MLSLWRDEHEEGRTSKKVNTTMSSDGSAEKVSHKHAQANAMRPTLHMSEIFRRERNNNV